jgi:hypothetical protein
MARSVLICSLRSLRIAPGKPLPSSLAPHQPANPEGLRSLVQAAARNPGRCGSRPGCRAIRYRSSIAPRTGLRSTIGVPSIASSPLTCTRTPSMPRTRTRCRPIGLGRLDARVPKTPCSGRFRSPRGWTLNTLRSASCNQLSMMISSPTAMPSRAGRTSGFKIKSASGASSSPWRGASAVELNGLFTRPIGRSVKSTAESSGMRHFNHSSSLTSDTPSLEHPTGW